MGVKRGSTIYIPIIVPENWQLAVSLACGGVGFVCLLYALFTSNWNVTTILVPESEYTYPLRTTLKWGLRSIHVKWCITKPHYAAIGGGSTASPSTPGHTAPPVSIQTCSSEDIFYNKCTEGDGYWCSNAADPFLSYWMIILACIGLVLSTLFALSRRMFQPVGYSACVIACSVSIIIFRACQVMFEPSGQLQSWIQRGETETVQGISYYVMTAGTFVLLAGMLFASWGTYRVMRRGHETAPSTVDQPNHPASTSNGAHPATARVEIGDGAAVEMGAAPTSASPQFQHSERVLSVIAAAPNRVGGIVGGAGGVGGVANNVSGSEQPQPPPPFIVGGAGMGREGAIVSVGAGGADGAEAAVGGSPPGGAKGGSARRLGIDNDTMDFETLNEPSAIAVDRQPKASSSSQRAGSEGPPMVPASPSPPRPGHQE